MSFLPPFSSLQMMLLNDRIAKPFILTEKLEYYSPLTGKDYEVPKHFRTDLASVPMLLAFVPVIGPSLVVRFFGSGVWKGAREGVLHDWLTTADRWGNTPETNNVADKIFREALYAADYPSDICELYYRAVAAFSRAKENARQATNDLFYNQP